MIDMQQLKNVNPDWNMGPIAMPGAQDSYNNNWGNINPMSQVPGSTIEGTPGGGPIGEDYGGGNLPTPWQWEMSQNILQNLYGMGVQIPEVWNVGAESMMEMMRTGRPTDVSGIYGAQAPIAERQMEELSSSMLEKFDVGGLGASTAYLGATQREMERLVENMEMARVNAEIGAQEAAAGRMIGAAGPGYQFGAGMAGIEGGNLDRQMQLANLAHGQGYTETMYPMQVAQGLSGLGGGMFNQQSQQVNQIMQWLGAGGQQGGGYYQPQYDPGMSSTLMNLGPLIGQICGGGGMPTTQVPPGRNVPVGPGEYSTRYF